jgi:hypothetical protein
MPAIPSAMLVALVLLPLLAALVQAAQLPINCAAGGSASFVNVTITMQNGYH